MEPIHTPNLTTAFKEVVTFLGLKPSHYTQSNDGCDSLLLFEEKDEAVILKIGNHNYSDMYCHTIEIDTNNGEKLNYQTFGYLQISELIQMIANLASIKYHAMPNIEPIIRELHVRIDHDGLRDICSWAEDLLPKSLDSDGYSSKRDELIHILDMNNSNNVVNTAIRGMYKRLLIAQQNNQNNDQNNNEG